MPLFDVSEPLPTRIAQISPSRSNDLLACQLQAAFGRDERFDVWRRPSTFSVLGETSHALAEVARKRGDWPVDATARRSVLEEAWEHAIAKGAAKLATAWAPGVPPPPDEWPGYQLTRSRTIRRADRAIISKKSARPAPDGEVTVEAELSDPGSILWGRVDRIDRFGSTTRVVDLKTGLKQGQPTEDQKRQLLLYAVLVERTRGEWPAEIAIENASGEQMVSPLDPAEAEAALAEVLAAADDFNRRIDESGAFDARPSADTCRWCAYRVVCDSYWSAVRVNWEHRSFLGEVTGSGTSGEGAFVDLRLESPVDATSSSVHLTGLPTKPQSDSVWFAAVDVRGLADPKDARARWSSRIRSW